MAQRKWQQNPTLTHLAFYPTHLSSQAPEDKEKKWYWKGLERFVNTGDSMKDYDDLSKAWPTFWPANIRGFDPDFTDSKEVSLNWHANARPLFLFYRDILRSIWIRDPRTSTNGEFINVLFGLVLPKKPLMECFPNAAPTGLPTSFYPEWGAGVIRFVSDTDFQRAIWLLFCELWRPKICPACALYFIADKPAQMYCSGSCSTRAHQSISLKWWREKGSKRRAARALAKGRNE